MVGDMDCLAKDGNAEIRRGIALNVSDARRTKVMAKHRIHEHSNQYKGVLATEPLRGWRHCNYRNY